VSLESKIDELIAALERNTASRAVAGPQTSGVADQAQQNPTPAKATKKSAAAKPPADAAPALTIKVVADKFMEVANNVSRGTAIGLLTQFKVSRVGELKAEHYPALMRLCEAALAKHAEGMAADPETAAESSLI